MPTQRPPKDAAKYVEAAPRGMWYESRTGDKRLPCVARWRNPDGTKTGRSFAEPVARAIFAASWAKQREEYGKAAAFVDGSKVETWTEFERLIPNVHPLTVAREWLEWRGTDSALAVADAWKAFNEDQEKRKLSGDTHSHRRLHGQRICAALGSKMAASVKTEDLDTWLAGLKNPDTGQPMGAKSKTHHLKTVRHFFEWLKDRRKVPHNPADAVTPPEATEIDPQTGTPRHKDVNVLPVDQARALFEANRDSICVGRLALEFFGGLRNSSAGRLRAEDIDWQHQGITLPGPLHKSGKRHYVEGWPANLWAWMKHAKEACWALEKREYAEEKRAAFVRAGLKPPAPSPAEQNRKWTVEELAKFEAMKNVARHSFATYHLAAFKDAKLTAYLLTKTSLQSLNNDYRGRATTAAGEAYFAIVP
jgi:site-specific recombinase XerC